MDGQQANRGRLVALADQCVMCGLCLPFCPTYAIGREEGESPRGRIALIKGLAEGRMPATPALVGHLDSCLACRRCEAVCPANVQYGELIAGARALPELAGRRPGWRRSLDRWLTRPRRLRTLLAMRPALALLRPWARRRGGDWARRVDTLDVLPARSDAGKAFDVAPVQARATDPGPGIVLFQGCVSGAYEIGLRGGAMKLLAALGESVTVSDPSLCCGSLARYGGDASEAAAMEAALIDGMRRVSARVVLGTATGCQAQLSETLRAAGIAVYDLWSFITDHSGFSRLRFMPLAARVAVHRPCSQRLLGSRSAASVDRLLDRIPDLVRVDLPEQDRCCGAAGSQFLARPQQAADLRDRVLADIDQANPDLLVSANIGCRLFLDAGVNRAGRRLPVLHPVELLARQLIE